MRLAAGNQMQHQGYSHHDVNDHDMAVVVEEVGEVDVVLLLFWAVLGVEEH